MLFAQIQGPIYWVCPVCNSANKAPRKRKSPLEILQCVECQSQFNYGLTLYKAPSGPRLIPRDSLMIGDGFTLRRLVNRCYCDKCGVEISNEALQTKPPRQSPTE